MAGFPNDGKRREMELAEWIMRDKRKPLNQGTENLCAASSGIHSEICAAVLSVVKNNLARQLLRKRKVLGIGSSVTFAEPPAVSSLTGMSHAFNAVD